MNIIFFGPPGAGKGTQAEKLSKDYNLFSVSSGHLLRNEINKETILGKKIKNIIDKGSLVSDEIINNLIENVISNKINMNRIIFDGYPRTINQAKNLELLLKKFNQKISCVLSLKVDINNIVKRIQGRQTCTKCGLSFNEFNNSSENKDHKCGSKYLKKRPDDQNNTITNRYQTYLKETLPIINFYKDKGIMHEINGEGEIMSIYEEIKSIISSLKT